MYSNSNGCNRPFTIDIKDDRDDREDKHNQTIIRCGTPATATIPAGAATPVRTFPVGSVTVNTSCLCDPCIKLEYASNLVATGFTGTVSFQVYRLCGSQATPVAIGPAWIFSIPAATPITATTTFSFFVCDCDSCFRDCCTYSVVATPTTATVGTLNINNATLGVIAASRANCCH